MTYLLTTQHEARRSGRPWFACKGGAVIMVRPNTEHPTPNTSVSKLSAEEVLSIGGKGVRENMSSARPLHQPGISPTTTEERNVSRQPRNPARRGDNSPSYAAGRNTAGRKAGRGLATLASQTENRPPVLGDANREGNVARASRPCVSGPARPCEERY